MIAIVTDKPDTGKEIARILGAHRRENGYMSGNGYMVTWTFGNMISLAMPKDYGVGQLKREDFPLAPTPFRLMVRHIKTDTGWVPDINAVLQLKVIEKVFAACDRIVSATDANREGEMLFRYLYQYLECKQPYYRLWISSLTDKTVLNGMDNLRSGSLFDHLYLAGDSLGKADWLLGQNASYALCRATGMGNNSLGRVQTPVLAAISSRYRERENHIATDTWPVFISLYKDNILFRMRCTEEFTDRRRAVQLYEDCKLTGHARITATDRQPREIQPPELYNLTELQKDANTYHGMTAGQSFDIAQRLYEKKLISYPRTSSRFLSKDVYRTLPSIMEKLLNRKEFHPYAKAMGINAANLSKRVIDPDQAAEHHAIIVTDTQPQGLSPDEMMLYLLIAGRMLEALMPACKVEYTTVDAICAARRFQCRAYRIIEKGWFSLFGRESVIAGSEYQSAPLPELPDGETVTMAGCNLVHKRDLPVSAYTDAELMAYMDTAGLGTAATRTNILQTLINRKYIRYSGRYIIPTRKGLFVYETTRGMKITDATLTSGWEAQLALIEQGKLSQEVFLGGVRELTGEITDEIFQRYAKE
ncbi:DNA topoisomerase [Bacteroides reticulotermitis]|nr:DNA topoisomerase [Bacteroides reticulotermitis]MBB4045806.1 DNA topoisomerase-3 [Bacteroides reticulotermitis]